MNDIIGKSSERAPWRDGIALSFALLFPLLMAWIYFVVVADEGGRANPWFIVGYSFGKLIQFGFPLLFVLCFARERLRPGKPKTSGLGLGLVFALLVAALMLAAYFGVLARRPELAMAGVRIREKLIGFGLDSPTGFVVLASFISVVHSLFEEYYWRWFVFDGLKRYLPLMGAIVVSGLGFMGHHVVILGVYFPGRFWTMALPFSLGIALGGMAWAWIYHRSGSLLGPWLSHALIDGAIMVIGYDLMRAGWE